MVRRWDQNGRDIGRSALDTKFELKRDQAH
jgi:hypothetical protein